MARLTPAQRLTVALDKFLKHHRKTCAVWIFSNDVRRCTCGRDAAIQEVAALLAAAIGTKEATNETTG